MRNPFCVFELNAPKVVSVHSSTAAVSFIVVSIAVSSCSVLFHRLTTGSINSTLCTPNFPRLNICSLFF